MDKAILPDQILLRNTVKVQIWIEICVYLLVSILKKELTISRSLGEILQILSTSIFAKNDFYQCLTGSSAKTINFDSQNRLLLNT